MDRLEYLSALGIELRGCGKCLSKGEMCVEKLLQNYVSACAFCCSFHSYACPEILPNVVFLRLGIVLILLYSPVVMWFKKEKLNQKKAVETWCLMKHVNS